MRFALALAIAALTLLAVGCGGGGSTSTPASTPGSQGGVAAQGQQGPRQKSGAAQGQGSSTAQATRQSTYAGAPKPGSKAAAPGVPVSRGGDNSIQTWGVEASSAERAQVTAIVRAYLDARAAANWSKACSYLAAEQVRMFQQIAQGKSCAAAMAALATGVPAQAFADEARIVDVLSLRVGGGHAFLIYTRPGNAVYATALGRKGGAWKVFSVGPSLLG